MATNRSDIRVRFQAMMAGDSSAWRSSAPSGDLDLDQDLRSFGSGSDLDRNGRSTVESVSLNADLDPDGLNSKIRGEYADLLKTDTHYLQARKLGVHPATLTNATKRMSADWVRKQVEFVMGKKDVKFPGGYLSKILARNPF